MDRNYDSITFISKYLYFQKPRLANFTDIITIVTMFIKTSFKDSKKLKELEITHENAICISISRYN